MLIQYFPTDDGISNFKFGDRTENQIFDPTKVQGLYALNTKLGSLGNNWISAQCIVIQ